MNKHMRERVLLYRLEANRDPDAFAELYDVYVSRIYRYVFFKVSSAEDAEDLTSEVFLKAWDYVNEKGGITNLNALLYRIARNAVIDHYRARQTKESIEDIVEAGAENELPMFKQHMEFGPKADIEKKEDAAELVKAMKKLKDEYREVLTMRFMEGLSHGEIAEVLEKSSVTVRVLQHRAMKALQRIIEQENGNEIDNNTTQISA